KCGAVVHEQGVLRLLEHLRPNQRLYGDPRVGHRLLAPRQDPPPLFRGERSAFRLNLLRCRVLDVPMTAVYAGEKSNLRIVAVILPFLAGHLRNFGKRIAYSYFLRDFSVASLEMVVGVGATTFGAVFGGYHWMKSSASGIPATGGTVTISGLCLIVGIVLLLSWINFDVNSVPREAFRPLTRKAKEGMH